MPDVIATMDRCLVTGGSGFLGQNIVAALLKMGCKVINFDIMPSDQTHENLTFIKGDISDEQSVCDACEGVDTVFHTAAIICLMGGSAVSQQYRQRAFNINVKGTENIIKACHLHKVSRLVYTSSNNVVFNGKPCPDMDSKTPYTNRVIDVYTETKMAAEKLALAANGKHVLLTCAIRPGGIYGPGKNYMLDGLVTELFAGRILFSIGNANSIQDNSFIDNLVHGHVLAAKALVAGNAACGKAYFITDDQPRNNWEFIRCFIEGLGYKYPERAISVPVLRAIAVAWEWLHFTCHFPEPAITPLEVEKSGITHFANIKDAERDLGYSPLYTVDEAIQLSLPYYRKQLDELKQA